MAGWDSSWIMHIMHKFMMLWTDFVNINGWILQGWPRPFALKLEKVTSNWVLRPAVLYQVASFWKVHILWMTWEILILILTEGVNFWEGILHPFFILMHLIYNEDIVSREFIMTMIKIFLLLHIRNNSIQRIYIFTKWYR